MLPNAKNGSFIVPYHDVLIGMDRGPLIELKGEVEDLTLQEGTKCDSLLEKDWEVLSKKEETDVIILVLYDVVNDGLNGSRLIVF